MEVVKRNGEREELDVRKMRKAIMFACEEYPECDPMELEMDSHQQFRDGMTTRQIQSTLIQTASEKTSIEKPNWQFVAARLLSYDLYKEARLNRGYNGFGYGEFPKLVAKMLEAKAYGNYLLGFEGYTADDLFKMEKFIVPERDNLFNYIGLKTLSDRYLKKIGSKVMELPQERFLIIAMHLAIKEDVDTRLSRVRDYYEIYSKLEVTVATPTLANAGTPFYQLSSCFIDTAQDDLKNIYDVNQSFAQVSKYGGGMGIYVGKIRSKSSDIRGHEKVSGGVVPWIKGYNNTAVAVDQLGVRAGAVAIYLDVWHKDILDFLDLKTNNGDDRMKAHDIFPGVCIPDIFMERVKSNGDWSLFCPHQIRKTMGYSIEDSYDDNDTEYRDFSYKYQQCENHPTLPREVIPAKEIMKRILTSCFETGTPFIFYRDTVNRANPNKHTGMIYCSNLCTEIMQNTSPTEEFNQLTNGDIIITYRKAGDFVVCNLSSLNLGRATTADDYERIIPIQMRGMDAVIDLNFYPVPQAEITNKKYRAVGFGVHGYHQDLAQKKVVWESQEHIDYADRLFELLNFLVVKASMELAKEKGAYPAFKGSEWETGKYFSRRGYEGLGWESLQANVAEYGVRNAWMFAVAPTASTSLIAGSTAGIDPVFSKFFVEEKKNGIMIQTAPNLSPETMWYYKESHKIDQNWSIEACAVRQRHIDQAQSFNLYITPDISAREFLALYVKAWELGLKTVYYCRNQSVELEEVCESCAG